MAATVSRSAATKRSEEQRVILDDISWETYESLLAKSKEGGRATWVRSVRSWAADHGGGR